MNVMGETFEKIYVCEGIRPNLTKVHQMQTPHETKTVLRS